MGNDGSNVESKEFVVSHNDLKVYRSAFDAAMVVFETSKTFPKEEIYSLTSQMRRSSRSVAANLVEAWRKRRYERAFVSKLSDAEAEAAETQVHIEFAVRCGSLTREDGAELYKRYEQIVQSIVGMIHHADKWLLKHK
ncbi:MAG: four helix bundle protein [Phycisphaeraceae bacterium]|nr:MAG: four helix bundle protein [Phycisphaeraceae bacterium]